MPLRILGTTQKKENQAGLEVGKRECLSHSGRCLHAGRRMAGLILFTKQSVKPMLSSPRWWVVGGAKLSGMPWGIRS